MRTPRWIYAASLGSLSAFGYSQVEHGYDLLDVSWSISFNESLETINGDVTNTVKLDRDSEGVRFHSSKLNIQGAKVNGLKAKFRLDAAQEQVTVDFPKRMKAGSVVKVWIDYSGKPQAGVYFTPASRAFPAKTGMVYTQGEAYDTRYWLPTFDHPSDKATSEGKITVPDGYKAISNGKLMATYRSKGMTTYHWKMEQPHSTYLISFVAGKYDEVKDPAAFGSIPVSVYVPAGMSDWGQASFGGTNRMVEFYSELTGVRYPYAKFAQCLVADFPFGGMENISAVTNMLGAIHPAKEYPVSDASGLNLHELAHQWFGDLVTCRDYSHAWINEGFATYLPHFWTRKEDGEDAYQLYRRGTMLGAVGAMMGRKRMMIEESKIAMDNFDGNTYGGGAARMFALMSMLGEDTFWKGVKQFLTDYGFKSATTEDFIKTFEQVSGKDLGAFRKEWFYTAGMPSVKADVKGTTLTLTQTEPVFTLDLDVWAWNGGQWEKQVVALHGKQATAQVPAGKLVVIDPEMDYPATVEYEVATPEFARTAYRNAPSAALKARMIELMASKGWNDVLEEQAEWEKSEPVRRLVLGSLPADQTDRWIRMSADKDMRIRQVAIGKLAGGPKNDRAMARLQAISTTESSDNLKLQALRGYVGFSKDAAAVAKAWTTSSYNDGYRRFALEWYAANNPDEARNMALRSLGDGNSYYLQMDAVGVLGRLKDKPGERTVFNAIVKYLQTTGFGGKQAAIGALQTYGDKAAIPILKPYTNYSMFYISQQTKGAIESLSNRK